MLSPVVEVQDETRGGFVDAKLDASAAPDALLYYPPVYYFHEALMTFAGVLGVVQLIQERTFWVGIFSAGAVTLSTWSIWYFIEWRPARLKTAIERNRVIWQAALDQPLPESITASAATTPSKPIAGPPD